MFSFSSIIETDIIHVIFFSLLLGITVNLCLRNFFPESLEKIRTVYIFFRTVGIRTYIDNRIRTYFLKRYGLETENRGIYLVIPYYHGDTKYRVLYRKRRGPSNIRRIIAHEEDTRGALLNTEKDVTHTIRSFMGPSHNFHGVQTTPLDLGHCNLTIELTNKQTLKFSKNQVIDIDYLPSTVSPEGSETESDSEPSNT